MPEDAEASVDASSGGSQRHGTQRDEPQRDAIAAAGVSGDGGSGESVGEVSTLYLGNILYAIERCALALDGENKSTEAAFYRGLGRKLAEAYGRTRRA